MHWGALFGRALDADVVVVAATIGKGETALRELDLDDTDSHQGATKVAAEAIRQATASLPTLPRREGAQVRKPTLALCAVEGADLQRTVIGLCRERACQLLLVGRRTEGDPHSPNAVLRRDLFEHAPCHTLLLRAGDDPAETAERILVPTAGGPHATVALRLAGALAEGVLGGIAEEAEGYDLVLMGTSSQWFIRRILFKTLPEAVPSGPEGTSVAVVRKAIPLRTRLEMATKQLLESTVPQLAREDRVALVERLQGASRWSFDFVFLTCLSTLIAGLGLIANDVAVVIGAMLVAPLMTPLLGAGLGLVQGNLVFLRRTLRTSLAGFVLVLGIGCLVGWIARPELTPEMLARGSPGTLDLVVAYASGMAAAYAMGRPGLTAALPGVAIAASLVPPIATAGLALVGGELHLAAGASLLFFTNLVAIALGAAATVLLAFWLARRAP